MSEPEKEKKKSLWDLELHEQISPMDGLYVMRVPGGWLYQFDRGDSIYTCTFVPYCKDMGETI